MIIFKDWTITAPRGVIARQYDNLSRRLEVVGELPEGYAWDLLVQVGNALDIITLEPMEGGVGVTLTADQLSQSGYYSVQLRGTRGEEVRHTNVESVFIPASLSGSGQWPTVPSEFIQAEQRIREIATHPPVPGENGFWMLWDPDADQYAESQLPLPEGGGGGTSDHSKLSNRDAADQHPMSSITGLEEALEGKQPIGDYLTDQDIDATLKEAGKAADASAVGSRLSKLSEEIANLPTSGSGSGLSSNAKTLLIAILRNAIYSSDQSGNITELEAELERTSDGGSGTVKYTIDSNLTNVTSDNTKVLVDANASYTATLTVDDGCVLDVVAVIMGGEDVTTSVYADGVITIPAVTGDVIITATAIDPNADILATTTWTDSLRANPSGEWTNQTSWFGSDLIACSPGDVITFALKDGYTGNKAVEYAYYNSTQTKVKNTGGSQYLNPNSTTYPSTFDVTVPDGISYIRVSLQKVSGEMAVYVTATKA